MSFSALRFATARPTSHPTLTKLIRDAQSHVTDLADELLHAVLLLGQRPHALRLRVGRGAATAAGASLHVGATVRMCVYVRVHAHASLL